MRGAEAVRASRYEPRAAATLAMAIGSDSLSSIFTNASIACSLLAFANARAISTRTPQKGSLV
ncbi:MAG: hypothetical protein CME06_11035 [Gemmatimonadetes bacterium]|nr:hypothetical protein [Gemmatimonadota bacterium]